MPTELPVATVDKTKKVVGRQSILKIIIAGPATHVFLVDYLGDAHTLDIGRGMAPGAGNGPGYSQFTWTKSRAEIYKFRTSEIKKVITAFGALTFRKDATCTAFVRDERDEANKVALLSEEAFACSVYRDPAEAAHSGDNPTEITIVIESHKDGAVTWTPDGATQAPA